MKASPLASLFRASLVLPDGFEKLDCFFYVSGGFDFPPYKPEVLSHPLSTICGTDYVAQVAPYKIQDNVLERT